MSHSVTASDGSLPHVSAFTDTYLPTINGVTYTLQNWKDVWESQDGKMDIIFPDGDHTATHGEYCVPSVTFPLYKEYRVGLPQIPSRTPTTADIVHTHTQFSLGQAAKRYACKHNLPLVATYHTPVNEYASLVSERTLIERPIARLLRAYERRFYEATDLILTPSQAAKEYVTSTLGVSTDTRVLSNGVDTEFFRPVDASAFKSRYNLPMDRPLLGYTGRQCAEKNLAALFPAVEQLHTDVTLVMGGDGPTRTRLEQEAQKFDIDVRFLGFLNRDELPALYSALDIFTFPSPVETEGLVAQEAMACGTPVVGVDKGALSETIRDGQTGYHYEYENASDFATQIDRALANQTALSKACIEHRDSLSLVNTINNLHSHYQRLLINY